MNVPGLVGQVVAYETHPMAVGFGRVAIFIYLWPGGVFGPNQLSGLGSQSAGPGWMFWDVLRILLDQLVVSGQNATLSAKGSPCASTLQADASWQRTWNKVRRVDSPGRNEMV